MQDLINDKHYKYHKLLKEICEEEGINISFSRDNWIITLEKNNIKKVIVGYKFDSNGHGLGFLIDDKAALSEYLTSYDIPVIPHHIIYNPRNKDYYAVKYNNIDYVKELFNKYNHNIVLKPNNGTSGVCVCHITNEEQLEKTFKEMSNIYDALSLCPYFEIENEYRSIMVKDDVALLYQKERPIIIGNGASSIKELLEEFNYEYFKNYDGDNKDVILKNGEEYVHNWKFNLSEGARANLEVDEDIKKNILALAKKTSKAINLGFGSIDIIRTKDNKYLVMEINSGVMMENFMNENKEGYLLAKNIYRKSIINLFSL